jgi:PEP-CTERM motif
MRSVVILAALALAVDTRVAVGATFDYSNRHEELTGSAVRKSMLSQMSFAWPDGPVKVETGVPRSSANIVTFNRRTATIPNAGNTLFRGTFSSSAVTSLSDAAFDFSSAIADGPARTSQLNDVAFTTDDNFVTPEPGTLGLLGTGLLALAGIIRRKARR